MSELVDPEFGTIQIRRVANARHIRLRLTPTGQLVATMPRFAPLFLLKKLIESSREALQKAVQETESSGPPVYEDGMKIGASHRIVMSYGPKSSARASGQTIAWQVTAGSDPRGPRQQSTIRAAVRKALDREAKAYLPRRLRYLADPYGFDYQSVRYSNAKGRWGSCSSKGVISLNVALMNLPMEITDYVLIHELCHTRHLNHSPSFWSEVERCKGNYKALRTQLKTYSPYL